MDELPEDDPRMVRGMRTLMAALQRYIGVQPITRASATVLKSLLYQFSVEFKQASGHTFPRLTPVILPRHRAIELYRYDLDIEMIQKVVINLTVKYPTITTTEVALAIGNAWPHYAQRVMMDMRREAKVIDAKAYDA
jgi:hypothetical protein